MWEWGGVWQAWGRFGWGEGVKGTRHGEGGGGVFCLFRPNVGWGRQ